MLHVVEAACMFVPDHSRGTIVIESDITGQWDQAIVELSEGGAARNLALGWAASKGMGSPCLNGNVSGAYAINKDGESLDAVRDAQGQPLPAQHPRMQIARYRIDIPLAARM